MNIEKCVRRFDLGEMREASRTPQGFLFVPGFASRTGVFPYKNPKTGKTRLELRHPDDVLDPESLKTLKYAPVTIEHPPVMLDPKNVAMYSVGHTTERVEVNRDMVDTDLIVEHQDGIDAIEIDGIRELSSGYNCDIVDEQGEYNGIKYDCRQKNIVYNHLAMVRRGRAGPEVRMRLDSADAVMQEDEVSKPSAAEFATSSSTNDAEEVQGETKKVVIMGREVDLPSDVADTVQDMLDRYDEIRAEHTQVQAQMEAKMAKRTDTQDVDISQKGVSAQVNVVQPGPDGRSAAGKAGAGDKSGPAAAKGDAEAANGVVGGVKPNDRAGGAKALDGDMTQAVKADPAGHEDVSAVNGAAGGGAAMSPLDKLKADYEEAKQKMDAMQGKLDEFAAASMNKGEAKPGGSMDSADVSKQVEARTRARVALIRQADKLVPYEVAQKFDSMSDDEIRSAVISHRHPSTDLKGKSTTYLEARFDSLVERHEEDGAEDRRSVGKELLEIRGAGRFDSDSAEVDPSKARLKMIQSDREQYKQPLTAVKK